MKFVYHRMEKDLAPPLYSSPGQNLEYHTEEEEQLGTIRKCISTLCT
jgi:hypothetical protein